RRGEHAEVRRVHPGHPARETHRGVHRHDPGAHYARGRLLSRRGGDSAGVPDYRGQGRADSVHRRSAGRSASPVVHAGSRRDVLLRRHDAADRRRRGDGHGAAGRVAAHHAPLRRLHEEDAHPRSTRVRRTGPCTGSRFAEGRATGDTQVALNVIMMGPPGAGKGTQAGRFARERGLLKISTGDILREGINAQLPVALKAKELMDRGELVDDATMIAIVPERNNGPLLIVDVRVPQRELVRRLAGRLICKKCGTNAEPAKEGAPAAAACAKCGGRLVQRADDNAQVVKERLKVYERATKPLVEFYRGRPTFRIVNGAQAQERVAHELDTVIDDAAVVGATPQGTPAPVKAVASGKAAQA